MLLVLAVVGFVGFYVAIIALWILDPINRHFLNGVENAERLVAPRADGTLGRELVARGAFR